jgi:hypothetical protein
MLPTVIAERDRLRAVAADLYRALRSEHGHDENHSADWPACLPVHIAMNRYRDALAGTPAPTDGMERAIVESMGRVAEVRRRQQDPTPDITAAMVSDDDWSCIDCDIPLEPGAPPICEECVEGGG